jgi:hypothetical protein
MEQVQPERGWEGVVTMYTHVSKCKIDKIKGGKKKNSYWGTTQVYYQLELNLKKAVIL